MAHPLSSRQSGLQGAVRSVLTRVAQLARERGGLIEKPWYHSLLQYDRRGNPVEQVTHNPNGTVARATYVYDAEGRLSEMQAESGRTVYLYAGGRLSYELSLRADGTEASQTRRFYEANGAYTEEFTGEGPAPLEGSGVTLSTERASFIRTRRDPAGRPLEMRFYDASGGLLYRFVYHYNAAGVLTDMEQRTGDQPLFELPAGTELAGEVLRDFAALFSPDTALSTVRYRYDGEGRRIEAATWVGAHCIDRRAFEYNDRGEKSAERRYGSDGKVQSDTVYEREYDGRGNWILERVSERGEPLSVTRRTIEYEEDDRS
jgi:YD repeat-containing protein